MTGSARTSVILLRLGIGWVFLYAGWSKVVTFFTDAKDWTAAGYLGHLEGTFADLFSGLAGNALVDYLNAYGLLLIGVALILGVLVRWSAFWGIVLMLLYWAAGFPPEHAFIVEDHIVYALVLVVLAAVGAGRMGGLDASLENSNLVKSNPWLLKLLG
jgi:thiosulfate dehydrogenase [quinone] large subunit